MVKIYSDVTILHHLFLRRTHFDQLKTNPKLCMRLYVSYSLLCLGLLDLKFLPVEWVWNDVLWLWICFLIAIEHLFIIIVDFVISSLIHLPPSISTSLWICLFSMDLSFVYCFVEFLYRCNSPCQWKYLLIYLHFLIFFKHMISSFMVWDFKKFTTS